MVHHLQNTDVLPASPYHPSAAGLLTDLLRSTDYSGPDVAESAACYPPTFFQRSLGRLFERRSVALAHEWIAWPFAGSERVFQAMERLFAFVDHDTLVLEDQRAADARATDIPPTAQLERSFLDQGPFRRLSRKLQLPLMPLAWSRTGADYYDIAIVSSHAMANRVAGRAANSIVYTHTPMRYAWLPEVDGRAAGALTTAALPVMRHLDKRAAQQVDTFVANSTEVAARIERFYRQPASVVAPPVDTSFFTPRPSVPHPLATPTPTEPFLVTAGRLVSYKRHDLAIALAHHVGMPIAVVGTGPEEPALRELAERLGAHAIFWPNLDNYQLRHVLRHAAALVHLGIEDFGILPVQAMACGTPVLTSGRGGALDYQWPNACEGIATSSSTDRVNGLERLLAHRLSPHQISEYAQRFSYQQFYENFYRTILTTVGEKAPEIWLSPASKKGPCTSRERPTLPPMPPEDYRLTPGAGRHAIDRAAPPTAPHRPDLRLITTRR